MGCAQIERMRCCPWCVADDYAIGWGILTPQVTEGAKAAGRHG